MNARRIRETALAAPALPPSEAWRRLRMGASLLDLRPREQRRHGAPLGSRATAWAFLDTAIAHELERGHEPLLLCSGGVLARLAATRLRGGFAVDGGFARWIAEGLPARGQDHGPDEEQQLMRLDTRVLVIGDATGARRALVELAAQGVAQLGWIQSPAPAPGDAAEVAPFRIRPLESSLRTLWPHVELVEHPPESLALAPEIPRAYDAVLDARETANGRLAAIQLLESLERAHRATSARPTPLPAPAAPARRRAC